jgi:hypothetical protein
VKKVSISELNPPLQNPPLQNPPLKKVEPNLQPNPLLQKVEQNPNVKEVSDPLVPTPQVPEPFLANSSETVGVLVKSDL